MGRLGRRQGHRTEAARSEPARTRTDCNYKHKSYKAGRTALIKKKATRGTDELRWLDTGSSIKQGQLWAHACQQTLPVRQFPSEP
eukprot:6065846-Pyramimonas_sp.AAC.2